MGGYFLDTDGTSNVRLGYGSYGVYANGYYGVYANGSIGISSYGNNAAGFFHNNYGTSSVYLAKGDYGVDTKDRIRAGSVTINATTRYYSIPGCAWQPLWSTYDYWSGESYTYSTTAGTTTWYAPVNLPHGAVITQLTAWIWDTHDGAWDEQVEVLLMRDDHESYTPDIMALVKSSGNSEGYIPYTDSSIDHATVDNQNYQYYLRGYLRSGDSTHQLSSVRITYTITEPLP
jgi:hypothetical protein